MTQVFVNDEELDVSPDLVVAITYQAADIGSGDIVKRKASFTNQISVPKTSNNREILGVSDDIHSNDTFPFVINGVRVLSNGIEILSGNCVLSRVSNRFNLRIYSVIKDLSTAIGEKMLDELDFGDSPADWNAALQEARRFLTPGSILTAPVVDYGQIDFSIANGTIGDYNLPSVVYKDLFTQILLEAGYTCSGDFYDNDTRFNTMAMTYGRKDWPGINFKANEILPDDIKQIDFIRDFLVKFGAYFRITGTDIEIITLEDILNDFTNAVDWTDKRANNKFELTFQWDGWARENNFTYTDVDLGDPSAIPQFGFNGSVDCGNVNLSGSTQVYESLFIPHEASRNGLVGSIVVQNASTPRVLFGATTKIYETMPAGFVFDNKPKPMLVILRDPQVFTGGAGVDETTVSVIYNGTPYTDYSIGMFVLPARTFAGDEYSPALDNLTWSPNYGTSNGLLESYYGTFESILQTPKKVVRQYKLNDVDIFSLDLLTLIFDEGDYFLINKVNDYVPGRLTEVELIRIYY